MLRAMDLPGVYRSWSPTRQPTTRVLVVDDNELMRMLISTMLGRRGYDVVVADDGPTAMQAAQGNIDIVLLDLTLPGMDGLEVCRALRAQPATARLPIIILTGLAEPSDVREGLRAGANDFLTKPFEELDLIAAVKRLARHRLPSRLNPPSAARRPLVKNLRLVRTLPSVPVERPGRGFPGRHYE
jgi:CheY-like chemotaxis protein